MEIGARLMLRGPEGWFLSRNAAIAVLGFILSLIGALGSAFYLEPAQKSEEAAARRIALEAAQAQMLRAANSYDNLAEHLGGLMFTVSLPPDASDEQHAAIGDLMRRALDHRHDGVRTYLAGLAVAGAIDYPAESSRYGALVAAEEANFNISTYRAANAFEGDLAMRMVKAQGAAAMKAITLRSDRLEAKRVASERGLNLLAITMMGSALVFLATIAGAGPKPPAPAPASPPGPRPGAGEIGMRQRLALIAVEKNNVARFGLLFAQLQAQAHPFHLAFRLTSLQRVPGPPPAEVFSQGLTKTSAFPRGARSDFYELYWADLSAG